MPADPWLEAGCPALAVPRPAPQPAGLNSNRNTTRPTRPKPSVRTATARADFLAASYYHFCPTAAAAGDGLAVQRRQRALAVVAMLQGLIAGVQRGRRRLFGGRPTGQ